MKTKIKKGYQTLKKGYILTIVLVLTPFIARIIYNICHNAQPAFADLEDVFEICGETLAIFLLGYWGLRTINLMKKNIEIEEKYEKEKGEMNKQIIASVLEGQEKERKKISRELHDGIGQNLSVLKMNMEMAHNHKKGKDKKIISKSMDPTIKLIDESIRELKKLSMDTRPNILDDHGLIPALKWYIKNCSASTTTNIKLKNNLNYRLSPIFETNIYRIVQEAVSNAIKHGKAVIINIFIKVEDENLLLSIIDNGNGFDFKQYLKERKYNNQVGIISMQERVNLMDGVFNIESQIGKGTNIEIKIPAPEKFASGGGGT
ncbi:MAG: sensor histidine kinase [bacterium]